MEVITMESAAFKKLPTQTALAGEVETTAPTTTTTSTTTELLQLAGEIDVSESDAVTSSDS